MWCCKLFGFFGVARIRPAKYAAGRAAADTVRPSHQTTYDVQEKLRRGGRSFGQTTRSFEGRSSENEIVQGRMFRLKFVTLTALLDEAPCFQKNQHNTGETKHSYGNMVQNKWF